MAIVYKNHKFQLTFNVFFPPFFDYTWFSCDFHKSFKKLCGFDYNGIGYFTDNGQLAKYISEDTQEKTSRALTRILKNADILLGQYRIYRSNLKKLEKHIQFLSANNFFNCTNQEITDLFLSIQHQMEFLNAFSQWYYFASQELENMLRQKWHSIFPQEQINQWMQSLACAIHPRAAERFASKIYIFIKENPSLCLTSRSNLLSKYKNVFKALANEFFWYTDFASTPRTPESFIGDIEQYCKKAAPSKTKATKIPVSKAEKLLFQIATYIKDEQSVYLIPFYWFSLYNLWRVLANRLGLTDLKELWLFTQADLARALLKNQIMDSEEIKNRQRAMCAIQIGSSIDLLIGDKAEKFFDHLKKDDIPKLAVDEIKGIPAFGGLLKGKVCIVRDKTQFGKFNQGDILIAPYTAPEYVPIMKKAKAIITDTGGITCHAAIISRELGIPCIIGTKVATKVLKDGDMVEVDANKGIVRIVK